MSATPATPTLPNQPTYGATDILAPDVSWWNNRSDYLAATGQQAPAFTAGQPVKRWVVSGLDLSDPNAQYQFNYLGLDSNGNPTMLNMSILAPVAAALNMQGMVSYQSYAAWLAGRAPTAGTVDYSNFGNAIIQPMDLSMLFTPDEAASLAAELASMLSMPATPVLLATPDGNPTASYNYDPNDSRRIYDIAIGTQSFAMGSAYGLFAVRNSFGVGAPGAWSWTVIVNGKVTTTNYAAGPRWTPTIPADGATEAQEYPIPVRALVSPPEQLIVLLGNVIAVERTDLMPQSPAGSGLTDAQAASLADIQAKVIALWKTLPPAAQ
jgi:hypothetical protein